MRTRTTMLLLLLPLTLTCAAGAQQGAGAQPASTPPVAEKDDAIGRAAALMLDGGKMSKDGPWQRGNVVIRGWGHWGIAIRSSGRAQDGMVIHDRFATGGAASVHSDVTKDGNTLTRESIHTGPAGQQRVSSDTIVMSGNTVTRTSTMTMANPNGKTMSKEMTITKDGNSMTREMVKTGPDGKQMSTATTMTKDGDTRTRETVKTGPNGGTISTSATVTKNADGSVSKEMTKLQQRARTETTTASGETMTAAQRARLRAAEIKAKQN